MNTLIKLEFNKLFSYGTRQGAREAQDHVGPTGCRPQRHRGHQWSRTARPAQQAGPSRYSSAFPATTATGATLPRTVLFLSMAKLPSKFFSSKFRNWLLYLVVSRQNLKSIAGYTLQALRQDGKQFQPQLDRLQPLYAGFDTGLTARAGASAGRGSQTMTTDTIFDLIKQFMKQAYKKNFAALEENNPALFK